MQRADRDEAGSRPSHEMLDVNGLRMHVVVQGQGPLVVFCHGFPELADSWRHQLPALAAAGWRAAAPDMRGYGATDAPARDDAYTMLHLVGDMVALVRALGETQAVIVGHDWGSSVAWNAAVLRPDVFRAVVGMSVPFAPQGRIDLLTALEEQGIEDFYLQYFQAPGVAEAELERDVRSSLRRLLYWGSGDAPHRGVFGRVPIGGGLLDGTAEPPALPPWLSEQELDHASAEFARTGFRGGLAWYRNLRRSWELLAAWRGVPIRQPSLFIAGGEDDVLRFPASRANIDRYGQTLPGLRGCHLLDGAGHWIQRERAAEVNSLLLAFLAGL
jgi:pimeloyl-ACP methyl ester carboxylesterase